MPFNESLTLVTESATLAVSDKDGKRLPGDSQKTPLRIPSGGTPQSVTINVGKR